jgi:hypothetical protein
MKIYGKHCSQKFDSSLFAEETTVSNNKDNCFDP